MSTLIFIIVTVVVAFAVTSFFSLFTDKGVMPKPESLSDKELAERVKHEERLLNKYKEQLHINKQTEEIKINIKEKEIYIKELLIESMKRMVLMTGKRIEDTTIPIMIRSIELMKSGLSGEEAQTQACNEFVEKRDAGSSLLSSKNHSKTPPDSTFVIGKSSVFSKKRLTPSEFGREITRLGFRCGVAEFEHYQKAHDISAEDQFLLNKVNCNPGLIQLLYANLITGAFLCYANILLHASDDVLDQIKIGILAELRSTMSELSEEIHEYHKDAIVNFSLAIEREVRELEEDSSLSLIFRYIIDFYPALQFDDESIMPSGMYNTLTGIGSRFMAACQNDFQISLQ